MTNPNQIKLFEYNLNKCWLYKNDYQYNLYVGSAVSSKVDNSVIGVDYYSDGQKNTTSSTITNSAVGFLVNDKNNISNICYYCNSGDSSFVTLKKLTSAITTANSSQYIGTGTDRKYDLVTCENVNGEWIYKKINDLYYYYDDDGKIASYTTNTNIKNVNDCYQRRSAVTATEGATASYTESDYNPTKLTLPKQFRNTNSDDKNNHILIKQTSTVYTITSAEYDKNLVECYKLNTNNTDQDLIYSYELDKTNILKSRVNDYDTYDDINLGGDKTPISLCEKISFSDNIEIHKASVFQMSNSTSGWRYRKSTNVSLLKQLKHNDELSYFLVSPQLLQCGIGYIKSDWIRQTNNGVKVYWWPDLSYPNTFDNNTTTSYSETKPLIGDICSWDDITKYIKFTDGKNLVVSENTYIGNQLQCKNDNTLSAIKLGKVDDNYNVVIPTIYNLKANDYKLTYSETDKQKTIDVTIDVTTDDRYSNYSTSTEIIRFNVYKLNLNDLNNNINNIPKIQKIGIFEDDKDYDYKPSLRIFREISNKKEQQKYVDKYNNYILEVELSSENSDKALLDNGPVIKTLAWKIQSLYTYELKNKAGNIPNQYENTNSTQNWSKEYYISTGNNNEIGTDADKFLEEDKKTIKFRTPTEYYSSTKISKTDNEDGYVSNNPDSNKEYNNWFWLESIKNWCIWEKETITEKCNLMVWNGKNGWDKLSDIINLWYGSSYHNGKIKSEYYYNPEIFKLGPKCIIRSALATGRFAIENNAIMYTPLVHNYNTNTKAIIGKIFGVKEYEAQTNTSVGVNSYQVLILEKDSKYSTYDDETFQNIHNSKYLNSYTSYIIRAGEKCNELYNVIYDNSNPLILNEVIHDWYIQDEQHRQHEKGYNLVQLQTPLLNNGYSVRPAYLSTQGCPGVLRLSNGKLGILLDLSIAGNLSEMNTGETHTLYTDATVNYYNEVCKKYFGDGSDKTIEKDWKNFEQINTDEEQPTNVTDITEETLYNGEYILSKENNINMTITLEVPRPNITSQSIQNEDYIIRWDK